MRDRLARYPSQKITNLSVVLLGLVGFWVSSSTRRAKLISFGVIFAMFPCGGALELGMFTPEISM